MPEFLSPSNNGISFDEDLLKWVPCARAVKQNIYIATSETGLKDATAVATLSGKERSYRASLSLNKKYYWRVDTILKSDQILQGTAWVFETGDKIYPPEVIGARNEAALKAKEDAMLAEIAEAANKIAEERALKQAQAQAKAKRAAESKGE